MKLIKTTIRSISTPRLQRIHRWYNDEETGRYIKPRNRSMEKIVEKLSHPKTNNFIINVNKKDVGYLYMAKKYTFVNISIIIDKVFWGRGYGKKTMILAEGKAKEMKAKKIILALYKENERAYNLYKSLGYVLTKRKKGVIIMEKII